MKRLFANFDWGIFISLIVLLIFGLMIIRSVVPEFFLPQLVYAFLGLIVFFLFTQLDYRIFLKLGGIFYFISIIGLVLTFVFGAVARGSIRWIQIGGFTLQPSELVKPFLILSFASFFVSRPITNLQSLISNLCLLILPALLIFGQPDLGSSLVVVFFWLGIAFAVGVPWRLAGVFGLLTAIFLPIGWFFLQFYQKARILTFLNPFSDPLGAGYNVIQSMIAVGSGQIFGRGLGRGTQSHLRFLPERHTDFIFASLSEELGFLGALFLILTYAFLFWRILKIAGKTKEKFGFLVCLGVFGMLFVQVFINVGMNLGLVPIAGITLPLISYGGSSLVATMISLGIVENIARLKYTYSHEIRGG